MKASHSTGSEGKWQWLICVCLCVLVTVFMNVSTSEKASFSTVTKPGRAELYCVLVLFLLLEHDKGCQVRLQQVNQYLI